MPQLKKSTMKTRFRVTSIFCAANALLLIVSPSAQAYTVTLQQVGSNVVATGSGAMDLTGLTGPFPGQGSGFGFIGPSSAIIETGPKGLTNFDSYGGFTGPMSFGGGIAGAPTNTGSGDLVGINNFSHNNTIDVPQGYISGTALSSSATWNNATFASLEVTPGTYVWKWGDGADQNFTLVIPVAGVPDSGSSLGLLFLSVLGLFGVSRFPSLRVA
jgi:hypothetical protein